MAQGLVLHNQRQIRFVIRRAEVGRNVMILDEASTYQDLKCLFCNKFVEVPIQTVRVGHRFCKACFVAQAMSNLECIECQKSGTPREQNCVLTGACYPDKGAEIDINRLSAQCLQCGFQASMAAMEDHPHIRSG